jgi:hypothetical protein
LKTCVFRQLQASVADTEFTVLDIFLLKGFPMNLAYSGSGSKSEYRYLVSESNWILIPYYNNSNAIFIITGILVKERKNYRYRTVHSTGMLHLY